MSAWKKRKEIEGVSSASIIDLKAVIYETEQQQKARAASGEKRPVVKRVRTKKGDAIWEKQNSGVAERNQRDLEEEEKNNPEVNAEERLRQKAALYQKLARGKIDANEAEEYLVDFEQKAWEEPSSSSSSSTKALSSSSTYDSSDDSESDEEERRRRRWEKEMLEEIRRDEEEEERKSTRKQLLDQLQEETKHGREKHQELKNKRQKAMQDRLNYIKQQKSQSQSAQSTSSDDLLSSLLK